MAQADAEDRNFSFKITDGLFANSGFRRPARSRRNDQVIRMQGFEAFHRHFIVADDLNVRIQLPDELVEIIGKTVVIIDEYNHLSIPPLARFKAMTTALALFRHSWCSCCGTLSATMPAPEQAKT